MYFFAVCVVFSHARIAFPKNFGVKHTIYFERPKDVLHNYCLSAIMTEKAIVIQWFFDSVHSEKFN